MSRLEKADILEMTVKYLRHVQRQQVNTTAAMGGSEPEVAAKFSAGYTECATEVIRYMDQAKCVTSDVRTRLESHLVERLRDTVCVPSAPTSGVVPTSQQQQQQQKSHTAPEKELSRTSSSASVCPTSVSNMVKPQLAVSNSSAEQFSAKSSSSATAAVTTAPGCTAADDYSRHYQTAVDLANMAAGVIVPTQTSSSHDVTKTSSSCTPSSSSTSSLSAQSVSMSRPRLHTSPARCKSISPPQDSKERGKPRKRFNSSESALPQQPKCANINSNNNTPNNDTNSAFPNMNCANALDRLQPQEKNGQKNESYIRSLQRPLHIEIPDTSDTSLYHSRVQPNQFHPNNTSKDIPVFSSSSSSPSRTQAPLSSSPSSSSSATTIYNYQSEDAPPTLLYAYNYNLPHRPTNQRQASTSPKVDYSLVVYQPENNISGTATTTPTAMTVPAVSTHGEKFHATFALEQRPRLNDTTNFYCAPNAPPQGHPDARTMQHPAAMNAPTTVFQAPTTTLSMPQSVECVGHETRRDLSNNNNLSNFYGPHSQQLHCPTFATSSHAQPGDRSLRKDLRCPMQQIPTGFPGHNNAAIFDNRIESLAPAELSSNHGTARFQFEGNPRTCASVPALPHPQQQVARRASESQGWGNQSQSQLPPSAPSEKLDTPAHRTNPHNNGGDRASLNGQSRCDLPPPLPPHLPHSPQGLHQQSNVPCNAPYYTTPPSSLSSSSSPSSSPCDNSSDNQPHISCNTSRPALKKHLLFGQRSEGVTRRHYDGCSSSPDDMSGSGSSADSERHIQTHETPLVVSTCSRRHPNQELQTTSNTAGGQQWLAAQGCDTHALSGLSSAAACVSSAKRPCLEPDNRVLTSTCYRPGGHMAEEPLVWRPW